MGGWRCAGKLLGGGRTPTWAGLTPRNERAATARPRARLAADARRRAGPATLVALSLPARSAALSLLRSASTAASSLLARPPTHFSPLVTAASLTAVGSGRAHDGGSRVAPALTMTPVTTPVSTTHQGGKSLLPAWPRHPYA